jgi:EmrB/QacA subfamily drug resistance transporter
MHPRPDASFTHREVLFVILGLLPGIFLAALDQSIVAPALPRIAGELGGSTPLSWLVAAYLLTATASTPIYGKLSDLYGRRALLQAAIAIFVAASLGCALAATMPQLVLARALQGLGGGGLLALSQAAIADVTSVRERGRYQIYLASVWAVASLGGPSCGGFLADYLSWRWIFWINLPVGLLAFLFCRIALRRLVLHRVRHSIDYAGAVLMIAGVTALLLVSSWAGTELPWTSPIILVLAGTGIALFGLFALQEMRAGEPILPPRILAHPVIGTASLVSFLSFMPLTGAVVIIPVFFQLVLGTSASGAGLLLMPLMGGTVIGAYASGQAMRFTGRYRLLAPIGSGMAAVALAFLAAVTGQTSRSWLFSDLVALGTGLGMIMPVTLLAVQNAAEPRDIGAATSSVAFFRTMGGSFGIAALWSVLSSRLGISATAGFSFGSLFRNGGGMPALPAFQPEILAGAFHLVFLAMSGIAVLCFLAALRLPEIPLKTVPSGADGEGHPKGLQPLSAED